VVSAADVCGVVLDGFTIEEGYDTVVRMMDSSVTIRSSTVRNADYYYGVESENSDCRIVNCVISDNGDTGVYCEGGGSLTVEKSVISYSESYDGINCYGIDSVSIADSVIHHNNYVGVWVGYIGSTAVIRRSTVVDNDYTGIAAGGCTADVSNCIVWGNGYSLSGCSATYCCIEDLDEGTGNIDLNPLFYDDPCDPNNYHLGVGSPCIDAGDAEYADGNETDIDGEARVMDGDANGTAIVDMGADEYYWSAGDLNRDGIVNFLDYSVFALSWETGDGEPNYDPNCDLAADANVIDYNDLAVLCADWLWEECWTKAFAAGAGDGMLRGGEFMESAYETDLASAAVEAETVDVEGLVDWLTELWLDDAIRKAFDEKEWFEFVESVKGQK